MEDILESHGRKVAHFFIVREPQDERRNGVSNTEISTGK